METIHCIAVLYAMGITWERKRINLKKNCQSNYILVKIYAV